MKRTLLHKLSEGAAFGGVVALNLGIGMRLGSQQTLKDIYTESRNPTTIEEKKEIAIMARDESIKRLSDFETYGPGSVFFATSLGLMYLDKRRERKKRKEREWDVYLAHQ